LYIGSYGPPPADNYHGIIDEIRILNITLTAEEIAEIYSG